MRCVCFLSLLVVQSFVSELIAKDDKPPPANDEQAKNYLINFGYIPTSNVLTAGSGLSAKIQDAQDALKSAIKKFQEFAGLKVTGILDDATREKMANPRCGVPDIMEFRRRGSVFKWPKNEITYSIDSYSTDLPRSEIRKAIKEAFDVWSEVTPLEFHEVPSDGDIRIRFASRYHGDPWSFDGRGGILAHATMPTNGILHFDEDENWVYMDPIKIGRYLYTDLLTVAIHEIGHTLGLVHSRDENAIMAPFYQESIDHYGNYHKPKLSKDDVNRIQQIYARKESKLRPSLPTVHDDEDYHDSHIFTHRPPTTPEPSSGGGGLWDRIKSFFGFGRSSSSRKTVSNTPAMYPDAPLKPGGLSEGDRITIKPANPTKTTDWHGSIECPREIDAVIDAGKVAYLFSGSKVYEVRNGKVSGVRSLKQFFPNGPPYVQAAVESPQSEHFLLFHDKKVYLYKYEQRSDRFRLDPEYPKRLPSSLTFKPLGAFRWTDNRQYILNGHHFALYDENWNKVTLEARLSKYFGNLPDVAIRGAVINGPIVTLFSDDKVYKYDTNTERVLGSLPIGVYLSC
ncbi:hypothetical protein AB6A40_001616 [Gnathostoma spinigerum]|uniref:Peptidase metallopeptidase domain-containing protein n=1 Tax=Gnathostoma spinigerum TaxID=75299 RepID=A0ABD6E6N8_9BILA